MTMTTHLRVTHETRYSYTMPVGLAHHLAFLRPFEDAAQQVACCDLRIDPVPSHHETTTDSYGNFRTCFSITHPHQALTVEVSSRVALAARYLDFDPSATLAWEVVREQLQYRQAAPFVPACEFAYASTLLPLCAHFRSYAAPSFPPGQPVALGALDLMHRIHQDFRYIPASTDVSTPVAEVFAQRRGVCQDFAHVFIAAMRSLGLSARYISGYLWTQPPAGQPGLIGAEASHAWVAVYCPQAQGAAPASPSPARDWLELDPTNDCWADTQHVRVATGRDFADVTPLKGVIRGGGVHTVSVRVSTTQA